MLYSLRKYNNIKFKKMYDKAITELNEFYNINLDFMPSIIFVNNRLDIDNLNCQKTEFWQVGWQSDSIIFLLDEKNLGTESNHKYSDIYYFQLIKHELSHYYYKKLVQDYKRINWIDEGLAVYVSG